MLYATWEDMQYDICGPRKGKSSSRAIPTLLAAPEPDQPPDALLVPGDRASQPPAVRAGGWPPEHTIRRSR